MRSRWVKGTGLVSHLVSHLVEFEPPGMDYSMSLVLTKSGGNYKWYGSLARDGMSRPRGLLIAEGGTGWWSLVCKPVALVKWWM